MLRTQDEGVTWYPSRYPGTETIFQVLFLNTTHGVAVGARGVSLHSADGGDSWTRTPPCTDANLYGVAVSPESGHGFAVGAFGVVCRTFNSGRTWTVQVRRLSGDELDLFALDQIGANSGGLPWAPKACWYERCERQGAVFRLLLLVMAQDGIREVHCTLAVFLCVHAHCERERCRFSNFEIMRARFRTCCDVNTT